MQKLEYLFDVCTAWLPLPLVRAPTADATLFNFTFLILALVAGLGVVVYFYSPYWGVRKVPGPPTIPLLGHLVLFAEHGPDVFRILANRYGPIFRFHMGRQPIVIVADPELCKEVGIKKFKDVGNRSIPSPISATPLHQKGLFFTRGTRWSTMRNTIVSLYQPSHLSYLIPTMQSFIESAALNLSTTHGHEEDVIFSDFSLRLAADIVGQAAFGTDFRLSKEGLSNNSRPRKEKDGDSEISCFIEQHIYATTSLKMDLSGSLSIILGLVVPVLQEPLRQLLRWVPWTVDRKMDQTNKKLSQRLERVVAKRMKEKDGGGSKDFLSSILNARETKRVSRDIFTSDYISALAYEHLLAGSSTTSFTLSSIIYLVSCHPPVEEKLLQEIDGFGPHHLIPTAEDLQHKFPYLDQVIKEAMRFFTMSPLIARETSRQVEIGGYILPKGTWVWLASGVLAKDPKHFPEPDKFRPERFDPTCDEEKKRHPYAHIPFGIGPRACVGKRFALQEIKLSLIHFYRKFVFRCSPRMEFPLEFDYGIVLNFKKGVKLQVIERAV